MRKFPQFNHKVTKSDYPDTAMAQALRVRFRFLLERYIPKLSIRGNRATGCAPCHDDRHPSFSADLDKCCWYCFACGRGGGIKDLAALVGEPWDSAFHQESRTAKAHRFALAVGREEYDRRQRRQMIARTDEFRDLSAELEVAEIAYRAIYSNPGLLSREDQLFWISRLGELHATLAPLEHKLNILTFRQYDAERFTWWREEVGNG